MAINPVSQTDTAKVASQAAATNTNETQPAAKEPTPAKTQPEAVKDTVKISSSAKEAAETAAQTAQESDRGDRQTQQLLAKEAAAKAEEQGSNQSSPLLPK